MKILRKANIYLFGRKQLNAIKNDFKQCFCSLCVDQGCEVQLPVDKHAVTFWLSEMVNSGALAIAILSVAIVIAKSTCS